MNFEQARFDMIEQQVRPWDVLNARVLDLMRVLAREDFVPTAYRELAYADMQIPLAHGQVMLPPREIGRIVQALNIQSDENVLEVGTGSGYLTALLSQQAQHVTSVDYYADLAENAKRNCQKQHLTNITFEVGDAAEGWNQGSMFSVICITGAMPELNDFWRHQLIIGGRLFVVLGKPPVMRATLVTRLGKQEWKNDVLYETLVPTLVHAELLPQFEF